MSTRKVPRGSFLEAIDAAVARLVEENRTAVKAMPVAELVAQLDDLAQRPEEFSPAFQRALVERAAEMLREE